MVKLQSIIIPLGTPMPSFKLSDPSGKSYASEDMFSKNGLLVGFFCNHCPYAKAVWPRYIRIAEFARENEINTVAINPNIHPDYPEDAPEEMAKKIGEWGIDFPYLIDDSQDVARAFKAQCTPDIFLFGNDHRLVYHGRIDDNWRNESKVTQEELKDAIRYHVTGQPQADNQMPCMGCSIKWRE